jgi:hypothetical protein
VKEAYNRLSEEHKKGVRAFWNLVKQIDREKARAQKKKCKVQC